MRPIGLRGPVFPAFPTPHNCVIDVGYYEIAYANQSGIPLAAQDLDYPMEFIRFCENGATY
ncbi:hypothetical protein [Paenirhodobacter populi]|uniref:hypothetical protein n=1 Tax=Paenirhodobacter populi TaxID=2306993 RepID=UPI000FE2C251|nr:hypothetical protein [Sinirhodobacter populi]RWR05070.1 hypothetical protein D2T32_17635 [Sinirhodobacter populi]